MAKASGKKNTSATSAKKTKPQKKGFLGKIVKFCAISAAALLLLAIAATIALFIIVDKPFIESQIEKQINRQVRIGSVNTNIFSAISGIEVLDVKISEFKSPKQLAELKGKPVAENDIFASMKAFKFKVSFPPLLKKRFVLNEIMLYSPNVNIVRYKNGLFNFSDLMIPKSKDIKSQAQKKEPEKKETAAKPVSADDIPVAINMGNIGMQDGNVNIFDQTTGQKLNLYKVGAKIFDIKIDPKNLNNNDSISFKISSGIKTTSRPKSGSVQSFDIGLDVSGTVIPFDKKDRLLNPEISAKAGTPYGTITGLQIFNEMMNVEQISKYSGKFDFLKKEITWKNGFVFVHYKNNVASLEQGKITNDDYSISFAGKVNIATMALDVSSDMTLAQKNTAKVKAQTEKIADKLLIGRTRQYVKSETISDAAIKPMLNDKGEIFLKYGIRGTTDKPKVNLLAPTLGPLSDVVKKAAEKAMGKAVDAVKEKATEKVKEKAKEKAAGKLKKLL